MGIHNLSGATSPEISYSLIDKCVENSKTNIANLSPTSKQFRLKIATFRVLINKYSAYLFFRGGELERFRPLLYYYSHNTKHKKRGLDCLPTGRNILHLRLPEHDHIDRNIVRIAGQRFELLARKGYAQLIGTERW